MIASNGVSLGVALEVPIAVDHAKARSLRHDVAYLRVSSLSGDTADSLALLASILEGVAQPGGAIYMQAVNEFVSRDRLTTSEGVRVLENLGAVSVRSAPAIRRVLTEWNAEALVLLFGNDQEVGQALEAAARTDQWWQLSSGPFEAAYIDQIPRSDPVGFFSGNHVSLEFFGTSKTIWRLLEVVRRGVQ
jgi:hypothetical protein